MSSTDERTTAFKGLLEKGGFSSDAANDIAIAAADEQVDLVDLDGLKEYGSTILVLCEPKELPGHVDTYPRLSLKGGRDIGTRALGTLPVTNALHLQNHKNKDICASKRNYEE